MFPFTDPFFINSERLSSNASVSSGLQISSKEAFPVKLMHILQLIDTKEPELSHIISWQPNGTSFRIHDKKLFVKLVKQRGFFNQKSYSSFRRQLNLWGFKKIGKRCKADCGVYGHPMFLRKNPHLCKAISRSGGASKRTVDEEIKALMEQENAAKIINRSGFATTFATHDECKFDVTAVTDTTKSIDTDNHSSLKHQEEYQFYGNLRKPSQTYSFEPPSEKVCSSTYYNSSSTTSYDENNDMDMLQDLDCFDAEDIFEYTTSQQESGRYSGSDLFNPHAHTVEVFDEDAFCEIEPLHLNDEVMPLPSSYGKYLRDALGNN